MPALSSHCDSALYNTSIVDNCDSALYNKSVVDNCDSDLYNTSVVDNCAQLKAAGAGGTTVKALVSSMEERVDDDPQLS